MDPREEVGRVSRALAELIERSGRPLSAVSRRLGHHPSYLSRVFAGRLALKLREAFEVLALIGVEPALFFGPLYPFAGAGELRFEALGLPWLGGEGGRTVRELLLEEVRGLREKPAAPGGVTLQAGRVLRRALKKARVPQAEASRAIGRSPSSLGQALRGNTELTLLHVLGCLAASGADPGRFFVEILGPADEDLSESLAWTHYLDRLEALVQRDAAGAAERQGRPTLGQGKRKEPAAPRGEPKPKGARPSGSRLRGKKKAKNKGR